MLCRAEWALLAPLTAAVLGVGFVCVVAAAAAIVVAADAATSVTVVAAAGVVGLAVVLAYVAVAVFVVAGTVAHTRIAAVVGGAPVGAAAALAAPSFVLDGRRGLSSRRQSKSTPGASLASCSNYSRPRRRKTRPR